MSDTPEILAALRGLEAKFDAHADETRRRLDELSSAVLSPAQDSPGLATRVDRLEQLFKHARAVAGLIGGAVAAGASALWQLFSSR